LTKEFDKALENYNKALTKDNIDFQVFHNLSLCFDRMNLLEKARELAKKSFKLNPDYPPNLIHLADLYVKEGNVALARKYYHRALEIDPENILIIEKIKNAK